MRPARKGPENRRHCSGHRRECCRFNEAGPQGAGKPSTGLGAHAPHLLGFNEAGPQGAGKPRSEQKYIACTRTLCFNEAGPQGAGKPSQGLHEAEEAIKASMRPARKGPENPAQIASSADDPT